MFDVMHIIEDERVKLSACNRKMWLGLGFISGRRAEIRIHHIRVSTILKMLSLGVSFPEN